MKTISFTVPCYNSAEYMDTCLETLVACDGGVGDVEVIIVDDGSTDGATPQKADAWQERYPETVRVIHKENGGHGSGVNAGLAAARGCYFKVVDSDDWLDGTAMESIMAYLRSQAATCAPTDLVIGNYVYEKVFEGTRTAINYGNVFPEGREFTWAEVGRFRPSQYLLMHSVIYRTDMLRATGLVLPEHCFYVDNIFVYVPLPAVASIRYFNVDMYRYFIGREGQSVNEDTMMKRVDQQLRVTRFMVDAVDPATQVQPARLAKYMENYLSMMFCICTVFLRMRGDAESQEKLRDLWSYLKETRPGLYPRIRRNILNAGTNLPGPMGRKIGLGGYRLAQKAFKFN